MDHQDQDKTENVLSSDYETEEEDVDDLTNEVDITYEVLKEAALETSKNVTMVNLIASQVHVEEDLPGSASNADEAAEKKENMEVCEWKEFPFTHSKYIQEYENNDAEMSRASPTTSKDEENTASTLQQKAKHRMGCDLCVEHIMQTEASNSVEDEKEVSNSVEDEKEASNSVEDEKEASNAAEVRKEIMKTDAQDEAASQAESSNYSVRRTGDLSEEDMLHLEMLTLLIRRARINQRPGDTHQLAHLLYDCLMPDFIDSDISEYESTDSEEETLEEISGKKFHKTKENERD